MKKNSIAKRVQSFKEDLLDAISNIRSPTQSYGKGINTLQTTPKNSPKTPINRSSATEQAGNLNCSENQPPAETNANDQLIKELKQQIIQVDFALKYFQDVSDKDKYEMLPGSATVILDFVSKIITTVKTTVPQSSQNPVIVASSASVYQALASLIRWSDEILKKASENDSYENIKPEQDVKIIVENLKTALQDLVQNAVLQTSVKDSGLSLETSMTPKRLSKSSNDSVLDEAHSRSWSSGSLVEDCEVNNVPPPKPPLPMRSIFCHNSTEFLGHEPSPPPPLPPKRRLNVAGRSGVPPFLPALFPAGDSDFQMLPDLVSHEARLDSSFNSLSVSTASHQHEVFHKEVSSSLAQQHHQSITSSSTMFSSSFSSFSSASFQSSVSTSANRSFDGFFMGDESLMVPIPPALPLKRRQKTANRTPSQYDNVDAVDGFTAEAVSVKEDKTMSSKYYVEEKQFASSASFMSSSDSSSSAVQLRREFSSRTEESRFSASSRGVVVGEGEEAPPLPQKKRHIMAYMEMVGPYSQPQLENFRQSVDIYNAVASDWQTKSETLFLARASSYIVTPPSLPPKRRPHHHAPLALPAPPQLEPPPRAQTPPVDTLSQLSDSSDSSEPLELEGDLLEHKTEAGAVEIRGGTVEALIIHATKLNKDDFLYQEAFLATYRTFISPSNLIARLVKRFTHFVHRNDAAYEKAANHSYSLLVRIVDDLAPSEVDLILLGQIMDFENTLVSIGDLVLAKALRTKLLEKCTTSRKRPVSAPLLTSWNVSSKPSSVLDFKSAEIAEQMTVLDAELFYNIEVPEVLVWAQEQNEEKTANLNLFTEHFNKVSYWVRSRILEQKDAKDRERYVIKFIKIMKHLRRLNNFNSYLALLSALDSAPIRRLEWQKSITDPLEEYCALIDSSSSFRTYRQALAETKPPCIPYIGLILQDLTFVHIGNPDSLPDGKINFAKRWQQFHILANMRRFQKIPYQLKRNEKVVNFFNDFVDSISEESMWSISETIKPRGSNNANRK